MTVITSLSPQRPSEVVFEVEAASAPDVATRTAAARVAQHSWWEAPPQARATALAAAAQALRAASAQATDLIVREVGKPAGEARGEVARSVAILDYYAQAAYAPLGQTFAPSLGAGMLFTERRPHGVAGLITPWNFPLAIPLWKAAPALVSGNAVLLKPSPDAVGCAAFLAELLAAHLPADLFAVVAGGAETGQALVDAADVVSFTGSSAVGSQVAVAAARRGLPVQCEMGGHNAAIVLPDADPAITAQMIASAGMGYAGQKCTATRRVVVVGDQPEFLAALVSAVSGLAPLDPAEEASVVGPVITSTARARVVAAASSGGRLLAGGIAVEGDGNFVTPAVVTDVPDGHDLLSVETFGPLLVVQQARDVDEAAAMADATPYGLVTSVHGRDLDAVLAVSRQVHSGLVKVNAPTTGVDFYAPFGGEKASSIGGREQGMAALDFYSATRTITIAPHGA
jgi:aldehyde dehydrogenase (NAD+)